MVAPVATAVGHVERNTTEFEISIVDNVNRLTAELLVWTEEVAELGAGLSLDAGAVGVILI